LDKYALVRKIDPGPEAYEWIPVCKTDIKSSGREYGLLFE
jgi:hypothetical protein